HIPMLRSVMPLKQFKEILEKGAIPIGQSGVPPHAHQLKNLHYPQVSKNVILSKKLARKDDIFYESFNSR
ncbi:hypothetical protein P4V32_27290, partial [Bacillus thuringiensis]|nr:hypothetical protein [Bacillus thuringiensis]